MKNLLTLLVPVSSVILALIVVWIYARETFEWVAILLTVYLIWNIVKWIRKQKE